MAVEAESPAVALRPGATIAEFNDFIQHGGLGKNRSPLADNPGKVEDLAVAFYRLNEDPKESPNLQVETGDDYSFLMDLLDDKRVLHDCDLALALLRMLKVLSRKLSNRNNMELEDIETVAKYLRSTESSSVSAEAASILLNACYEKENVSLAIKANAVVDLSWLLDSDSEDVAANATGALQSLSYQEEGRVHIRELDILEHIFPLLSHSSTKVRTRAVGVIHNMSSDLPSIAVIRTGGAIQELVTLLSDPQVHICSSAAGAIQNLSREQLSKEMIMEVGGVPPLTDLLFGSDVQTQVCAAGALLNILGPQLETDPVTGVQQVTTRENCAPLLMRTCMPLRPRLTCATCRSTASALARLTSPAPHRDRWRADANTNTHNRATWHSV